MKSMNKKKKYEKPELIEFGSMSEIVLGCGGSSYDGKCTYTQKGWGNDNKIEPHDGGY